MVASGKLFEYEITKALKVIQSCHKKFMWFRVQDTQLLRYATGNKKYIADTVPCDFMAFKHNKPFFIECKSTHNPVSYRLEYIKSHQLQSMLKAESCGCDAWFLINCRKRKKGSGMPPQRMWAVRPSVIAQYFVEGLKSVKFSRLNNDSLQIRKNGDNLWDLRPMFRMVASLIIRNNDGTYSPSNASKEQLKSSHMGLGNTRQTTGRRFRVRLKDILQHS